MRGKKRLTGEELLQRTDITVRMAQYRDPGIAKYRDNPLIHSLLSPQPWIEVGSKLWREQPPIDPLGRSYPTELRLLLLLDVTQLFEPLDRHQYLDYALTALMNESYIWRNPLAITPPQDPLERLDLVLAGRESEIRFTPTRRDFGLPLIAVPGMGKTASIRRKKKLYNDVTIHNTFIDSRGQSHRLDIVQIPMLIVTCPEDGSSRSLGLIFFEELDFLIGTNFADIYSRKQYTKTDLLKLMRDAIRDHFIGLLVFDELQRLNRAASGGDAELMDYFVRLMGELGVPCVFVGTPDMEPLIGPVFHKVRRLDVFGDRPWTRLAPDEEWDRLIKKLWPYQYLKTEIPLTPHFKQVLYVESQGIIDYAVKLYLLTQAFAIINKMEECFTPALIELVAKEQLHFAREVLDALKSGDHKRLSQIRFADIPPWNLTESLRKLQEQVDGTIQGGSDVASDGLPSGGADEGDQAPSDTNASDNPPSIPSKPTTRRTEKPTTDVQPPAGSILAIVAEGQRKNKAPFQSLLEAGIIRDGAEFLDEMLA